MKISKKIKRLSSVNLHSIVNDAARDNEDKIIALNQDQMYKKGIMDINKPTEKLHYAAATARQKKRRATYKQTAFITLRWFGDFYEAMKLVFFRKHFIITSDDLKWANWLEPQDRFENALGLTDRSMVQVRRILKSSIISKLKQRI